MSYRNKTYVAFASEDILQYRLMTAWHANAKIDFNFYNAHDLAVALDTSQPETIRRRLRERLSNTKQVVMLGSAVCRAKAGRRSSFIHYEIETIIKLGLPVVVANLDGDRTVDRNFIPQALLDENYYTLSVSFQPGVIKYALDRYVPVFAQQSQIGPHQYNKSVYEALNL